MTVDVAASTSVSPASPKAAKRDNELSAVDGSNASGFDDLQEQSFALTLDEQRALQNSSRGDMPASEPRSSATAADDSTSAESAHKHDRESERATGSTSDGLGHDLSDDAQAAISQAYIEPVQTDQLLPGLPSSSLVSDQEQTSLGDYRPAAVAALKADPNASRPTSPDTEATTPSLLNDEAGDLLHEGSLSKPLSPASSSIGRLDAGTTDELASTAVGLELDGDISMDASELPDVGASTQLRTTAQAGAGSTTAASAPSISGLSEAGQTGASSLAGGPMPNLQDGLTGADAPLPQQLRVDTPMSSADWGRSFADRIAWISTQAQRTALIQVTPAELGPVQVEVNVQGSQASINFSALQSGTREAIEAAIPRLREALADSGLELTDVQTSAMLSDSGGFAQFENRDGQSAGENAYRTFGAQVEQDSAERASASRGSQLGLVDTFA